MLTNHCPPPGHSFPHPGQVPLAFLTTWARCWLMSSLLSISAPLSLSVCLATLQPLCPQPVVLQELLLLMCTTWNLVFLKLILADSGPRFSLLRSLYRALLQFQLISTSSKLDVKTVPWGPGVSQWSPRFRAASQRHNVPLVPWVPLA